MGRIEGKGSTLGADQMQNENNKFAHVLLFSCPACRHPLASACLSDYSTLEIADGHWFRPHCHCGWTGDVIGLKAKKHWVESWLAAPTDPGGSCETTSVETTQPARGGTRSN